MFQAAEAARHRQVWEEAIRLYRFALQKSPSHMKAIHGLALSYEAKSREPGYGSYLESAMGEYRKMTALEPRLREAHDGLLAAAVRAGLLDELMEEYKSRISRGGDVLAFQECFRKMQALLLLRADPVKRDASPPPAAISFLFGLIAPGMGLICAGAALFLRVKGGGSQNALLISYGLMKLAFGAFTSFLGYKIFLYWRVSR